MKKIGFFTAAAAAVILATTAGTAMADSSRDYHRKRHYSHSYSHRHGYPPHYTWGDAPASLGRDYGPRGRGPRWMERNSIAAYKRQQEMQWQSDNH